MTTKSAIILGGFEKQVIFSVAVEVKLCLFTHIDAKIAVYNLIDDKNSAMIL